MSRSLSGYSPLRYRYGPDRKVSGLLPYLDIPLRFSRDSRMLTIPHTPPAIPFFLIKNQCIHHTLETYSLNIFWIKDLIFTNKKVAIPSKSLRAFLGSQNFNISRDFYSDLGFQEHTIDPKMSYFTIKENMGFYLQDYYVKDWIENTMMFLEVDDIDHFYAEIMSKQLPSKYPSVKITGIKTEDWGQEFHMLDPAGILWHFGLFKEREV